MLQRLYSTLEVLAHCKYLKCRKFPRISLGLANWYFPGVYIYGKKNQQYITGTGFQNHAGQCQPAFLWIATHGPKCIRNLEAHLRQAEGRRPKAWERERSEQHSTRSVFISEWTLAGGAYVYSTQSTLARSIFINTRGQLSLREIQKSWGKFQKKSRKSPEKVQKKSRKSPEKDQNHPRVCFRKV